MRYVSVQHIWNLSQQIYLETSSLKHANNAPKLPGVDNVVKNWALAMTLKALPLVNFWSIKLAIFYQLFVGEVCPENSQETGQFFWEFLFKSPAKFYLFFTTYENLYSMARSIRFENIINRSPYKFGDKLALFMRFGTFFMMKAKQDNEMFVLTSLF